MEIINPAEPKNNKNKKEFNFKLNILMCVLGINVLFIFGFLIANMDRVDPDSPIIPITTVRPDAGNIDEIKKFSSEQEFKDYLEASSELTASYSKMGVLDRVTNSMGESFLSAPGAMQKNSTDGIGGGGAPDRISDTNVQVIGIDEPDIVKTDGKKIYFSGQQRNYPIMMRDSINSGISFEEQQRIDQKMIAPYPYPVPQPETKIVNAFPPADLAIDGKIDKQGDMLLDRNMLIIFPSANYYYGSGREITGYDVSNPKSPAKKWNIKLDNNTVIVTSRLHDGEIYLITRNSINTPTPCPIRPMSIGDSIIEIPCGDIYHPAVIIPVDTTFTAMLLNPANGRITDKVSFVGSSGQSIIYVSENAIYAAYAYNNSIAKFLSGFVGENSDLFPPSISQKISKLETYDISENAKLSEITQILEKYTNSLDNDEQMKAQNEMNNRMNDYYKRHKRDLEKTGIVKIDLAKFKVTSTGSVPGHLLNNFSMDEYRGNLRVATTIGSRGGIWNGISNSASVSDVYVLDKDLKTLGSVEDLGKTEQIYSVRFIEDKGYVVTFRQTDPFYVLDLANPKNLQLAGELKIPGYSSYLHPLDATHILGIGMEGSQVKISLFDVTDKNNPLELDKYLLDEYWSEVSNNYHAFLLDTKHNIFFLPGSKGGYVFLYKKYLEVCTKEIPATCSPVNGVCTKKTSASCSQGESYGFELQKVISQNSVKRAIYLNDYLYIIGEDKITVLNENDWETINSLDLQ